MVAPPKIEIVRVAAFAVLVMVAAAVVVTALAASGACFGKSIELGLLLRREHLADLLTGGGGFQRDGFVEFPRSFLARGNDFFNLRVLVGGQREFAVHAAEERLEAGLAGTGIGHGRRRGVGGDSFSTSPPTTRPAQKMASVARMTFQAFTECPQSGQRCCPRRQKGCFRRPASGCPGCGRAGSMEPTTSSTDSVRQKTAPRQSAVPQSAHESCGFRPANRAMMRFSKA